MAYITTGGLPGDCHEVRSTQVESRASPCGSFTVTGAPVCPLILAKYSAVARVDVTVPRRVNPSVTIPPANGLMGSAVPLITIAGMGMSLGVQARLSGVGMDAEIAAMPANSCGRSMANR